MIKPASSLCGMKCDYCFYYDVAASRQFSSMGIMSCETAGQIIKNVFCVLVPGDRVTFMFQGGEPGLAGLDFFEFFVAEVKKSTSPAIVVNYALQTNGLMIDNNWCNFLRKNNFLVGLSLDGYAALHNLNRRDSFGKGTFNRVMDVKKNLDTHKVMYNILCVLTSESARRAKRIWNFIIKEKISHIQFIPCLEPLESSSSNDSALTGNRFYNFYSDIYPLWKQEALKRNVISVRLFEDLSLLFLSGHPVTCGVTGKCSPQIIVEADGGVYPCDFYVLDQYRVSDLTKHNLREAIESVINSSFIKEQQQLPIDCMNCSHNRWCRGGCKRMAKAVYGENCGMKRFADMYLNDLLTVYKALLR